MLIFCLNFLILSDTNDVLMPGCASIDPLFFALENADQLAGWHDFQGGWNFPHRGYPLVAKKAVFYPF
jgi:hypothetical protein